MNKIKEAREHFDEFYQDKKVELESVKAEVSPSGNYELKIQNHIWRGLNASADFANVEVWDIHSRTKLLEFNSEDTFWHIWVEKDAKEYLVFAEHRGGQSVIEFPALKFESYFQDINDFIWIEFHPSPNKSKLAIIGCHWACPYEVVVYDFRFPMNLPFSIVTREILNVQENFDKWLNDLDFSLVRPDGATRTITLNHSSR
jgi:hypothetical protein